MSFCFFVSIFQATQTNAFCLSITKILTFFDIASVYKKFNFY